MTDKELKERRKDTEEVLEDFQQLPISLKAELLRNIAGIEWAYRAGYADGLSRRTKDATA